MMIILTTVNFLDFKRFQESNIKQNQATVLGEEDILQTFGYRPPAITGSMYDK